MTDTRLDFISSLSDAIDNDRGLAGEWYTRGDVFDVEQRYIFDRTWQYAGHASELKSPGDFITCYAGALPVVVVRDTDDTLNGFVNICRHRQHEVASGSGSAKSLQCHYHGWNYGLDGTLKGVPRGSHEASFDRSSFPLKRVLVDTWDSLVFVNPDLEAGPLANWLGEVPDIARERGLNLGAPIRDIKMSLEECNWKVWMDNTAECYHCATVHPELNKLYAQGPENYEIQADVALGAFTQMPTPRGGFESTTGPMPFHFYSIWPTLYVSGATDRRFMVVSARPLDVSRTLVRKEYHCAPDEPNAEVEEWVRSTEHIFGQDSPTVASVQRGLAARAVDPGPLFINSGELLNQELQKFIKMCLQIPLGKSI